MNYLFGYKTVGGFNMNHYVYEITNTINGRKYIGKRSCHCLIEKDKYMGSGKALLEAINKYGIDNFSKTILKVCDSEENAYFEEQKYIQEADAVNNRKYYNIVKGGMGISSEYMKLRWQDEKYRELHIIKLKRMWENEEYRKEQSLRMKEISDKLWQDEQHRKYISKKMKKLCSNPKYKKRMSNRVKGENNPMFGTKHTEEEKEKLRNISVELWQSEEYRNKTTEAIRKACNTDHFKEKMSKLNSGKGNPMYGKNHSEESKLKISKSKKGKFTGAKSHNARKIMLLNTGEFFDAIIEAEKKYNIRHQDISKCCIGKRKSAGKINGEKAIWKYID